MKQKMKQKMKPSVIAGALLIALTASACAHKAGTSSGGQIPYATGADQLLLRVAEEGGFISPLVIAQREPQFSLFGDGTVITVGASPAIYPGSALPPLLSQTLNAEAIQAVLRAALDAGLGEPHAGGGMVGVSDAGTTVFTFNANDVSTTVKIYALGAGGSGKPAGMSDADYQLRQKLQQLVSKLGTLEQWVPKGSISAAQPYFGVGAAVYVSDYRPDPTLTEPAQSWPLTTPLASFGTPTAGARCGAVTGQDWTQTLLPLAKKANGLTPWTEGTTRYSLAFRPLLADQTAC
jgi:hypothetical protein